jgi:cytochrome c peroxidase
MTAGRRRGLAAVATAIASAVIAAAQPASAPATASAATAVGFSEVERRRILQHSPLLPAPADPTNAYADHGGASRLGQFLFFDARLSGNGQVSCATCHDPARGLADGKPLSEGMQTGTRNSPALWNVAYNRWFFWDGRADTLWAQALGPLEQPAEMGGSRLAVVHLICGDAALHAAYETVFGPLPNVVDEARFPRAGRPVPDEPQHPHHVAWSRMRPDDQQVVNRVFANVGKAIAAYERRLISRRSPFDVFVEGLRGGDASKLSALSPSAQRGLKLFIGPGNCRLCHSGPNFTDGEFHNTGVPPRDGGTPTDAGRYAGIERLRRDPFSAPGEYSDQREGPAADKVRTIAQGSINWGQFKVPSLRNVALTAPYMHQGQFATLEQVVSYYSTLKDAIQPGHGHLETILKPLNLTDEQAADLVAFLNGLTDAELDAALLTVPGSPGLEASRSPDSAPPAASRLPELP